MRRGIEIYKLRRFASKKRGAGANLGSTLVIDVVRGGRLALHPHPTLFTAHASPGYGLPSPIRRDERVPTYRC
jgi:hypothetical protein